MVWATDCILLLGVFHVAAALEGYKWNEVIKFSHTSHATHLPPRAILLLQLDLPHLTHNA